LLGTATAAMGQSWQGNLEKCKSVDSDTRITGCTAIIQSGLLTKLLPASTLSIMYDNRGTAYYNKGDYDRAIQDYDQAIRINPNGVSGYYSRGSAYYKKGDYDRVIQDLNEAIRLSPKDTSLYDLRGESYKNKSDYDRAIQDFNEAIHLNPNFERAYFDCGNAYIDKDDYDRAIQEFDEAIRLNANDAHAYNSRGVAYERKGDYDRAIQNYNQAILLNSDYTSAYSSRGSVYFAQSNLTAAIADFEHTISAAPSSSTAVYAVLMLHVIMKRQGHDDAQQLARVAMAADLSKWPGPVLKLDLGQMTVDEVMVAAASPGTDRQKKGQVCTANYFTGEDALLHHQRTTALARLKAVRDGCPKGYTDYVLALAELERLGATTTPAK
jgi:tetratricopeptide (TPR) repeat protein